MSYGSFAYGSTTYGGAIALAQINNGLTKIRPKVLLRYGRINQPIRVPIYDLLVDSQTTFLTQDSPAGLIALQVQNTSGFATNQILLIGSPGQQNSEIIKISSTTAPANGVITLASATTQNHGSSTTIYVINYDTVEFSTAVNLQDPKMVLATLPISADTLETDFNDNFYNDGFYFARWFNTNTMLYSPYSDGVPLISYTKYMARSIIQGALGDINKDTSEVLTDEFAFQTVNLCQQEVLSQQKRWSFMALFDQEIGQVEAGGWSVECPDNLPEDQTNKYVYQIRIGKGRPLIWIDKEQFNKFLISVGYTTLKNPVLIGDASITLEDSGAFQEEQGTAWIGNQGFEYSANNRQTGVLTLNQVSTNAFAAGYPVFQGAQVGHPRYWTSWGGNIYFYPIADAHEAGLPILMDYYAEATEIKTDTDEIVFPDAALATYYCEWKFLLRLNKGQETPDSEAKQEQFNQRLTLLVQKNSLGRTFRLKPRINDWSRQMGFGTGEDPQRIRDGAFPNI